MNKRVNQIANPKLFPLSSLLPTLLVGLLIMVGGIVIYLLTKNSLASYDSVNATIVEINESAETTYVTYVYNGITYTHQSLGSYSSTWHLNDIIQIYVNTVDPTKISSNLGVTVFPGMVIGIGSVLALYPLVAYMVDFFRLHITKVKRTEENKTHAKLDSVERSGKGNRFVLLFLKGEKTYHSLSCSGDEFLIENILKDHEVQAPVYLDKDDNFIVDYHSLNILLDKFRVEDGLTFNPPHGRANRYHS
jgi:hypothetical protein